MALISSDTTPYGLVKNFQEVPFAAAVGASDTPIFVLALKEASLPVKFATTALTTGGTTRVIQIASGGNTVVVGEDEYAGMYLKITFTSQAGATEVFQIEANDAVAADGDAMSITLVEDASFTHDATDFAEVRLFYDFKKALFHTDLRDGLDTYYTVDADGAYNGANHDAVPYDMLNNYAVNGGGPYWVLAVEHDDVTATLVTNLSATTDATVVATLRSIVDAGKIVCPKGYTPSGGAMASADHATVDGAWIDYCDLRATNVAEDLREHVYVMGVNEASSAAAATYIGTTLNKTSERHAALTPRLLVRRQDGLTYKVDPAGYYAAVPNKVHSLAAEGVGHSMAGAKLTQLAGAVGLEYNPTLAERPTLQAQNINYVISTPGVGTYILGSRTGKKTKTSPLKQWHVVETRNYVWDGLQTIAKPFVMEPNTATTRSGAKTLFEDFLQAMVDQGQINDFRVTDSTTANDISNSIMRMTAHILALGLTEFLELTVVSQIGEEF